MDARLPTRSALFLAALIAGVCVGPSGPMPSAGSAAWAVPPEPDAVPKRWQLEVEPGPLRIISIETPETGPRAYFYMTYRVSNTSGEDLLFAPAFDLLDDQGRVHRSGRDVPGEVTKQVLARLDNPLIQDQIAILGLLKQGRENARQGVVIWPAPCLQCNEITIFAGGFSGETRAVQSVGSDGGPVRVLLKKTLQLRFESAGSLESRGSEPFGLVERRWIMR